jgi:hypothetical protein
METDAIVRAAFVMGTVFGVILSLAIYGVCALIGRDE